MARYSDNREQNLEIKYLRKRLLELDERIAVPESVRGEALVHKLEGVRQQNEARTAFGPRDRVPFTLHKGLAVAALFAVVVGVVYGAYAYRPEMIEGGLVIAPSESSAVEFHNPLSEDASGQQTLATTAEAVPQQAGSSSAASASEVSSQAPVVEEADEVEGVGGGGKAELLIEKDGLGFHLRHNDPSDPDRAASPLTLEIIDSATEQLVGQIDMPDVQAVLDSVSAGDELVDRKSTRLNSSH